MGQQTKILIIEDERDLADIYSLPMKTAGMDVTIVFNGVDALDVLHKREFDLVLLDLFMPDMDGLEVLQKIRADAKFKNLKVYVWSNLTQQKQIEAAQKNGATGFLIKSDYTPKTLLEKVQGLLK